jgi:hypothetical protein
MTADGEQVKSAGIEEPDPGTAVSSGGAAGTAPGRCPVWVWAIPFALLFALLCVRNRFLFTTRLYEQGDAAVGIDDLSQYYIGYFYWSAPLVTVLVIVLAAFETVPRSWAVLSTGVAVLAACLDDPWYTFLMTRQFICTPAQTASGQAYWFYTPHGLPPHTPVILRFSGIAVAPASS